MTALALSIIGAHAQPDTTRKKRTVYMSYILHGNMNYDRYVRTTIWRDFPAIYDNLLDFMDQYPDFKGQLQFSGQTLNSLKQAAPHVLEHALKIHERGQINFTGTFYSEPVNVNMDGETNYRCALLGTKIIEDFIGKKTDGFYLQERAYHPQLPWILNNSDVSWTPVITGDDTWRPFKLTGMDGSVSVCVPITSRKPLEKVAIAPANSLIVIEEDYEIPHKFSRTYNQAAEFNRNNPDIEIVWITVKEYIEKFGTDSIRYVDHSAKVRSLENGTYSRWTADPLDIIVQDMTNRAMADFRSAITMNSLLTYTKGWSSDKDIKECNVTTYNDPLAWNIERADIYPDVEPSHLTRNGKVTTLSRAEHLLLWAVNSDSKGWYPLYEKRSERMTSLKNSSSLSTSVIEDNLDKISSYIRLNGYDTYFIAANMEQARKKQITLECPHPYAIYDYNTGKELKSVCRRDSDKYTISFDAELPAFGYTTFGAKETADAAVTIWEDGESISADGITITASKDKVTIEENGFKNDITLAPFKIKALAEIAKGEGDDKWRDAQQYGRTRIQKSGSRELIIDRQIDWLVHMRQKFTIQDGKSICDISFNFPHPTVLRKLGEHAGQFDPRGLDLHISSGLKSKTVFDIPFGMTEFKEDGTGYFCPLSTCIMENERGGIMVAPQTGEQGFSVNADNGEMTLHLGASTESGPIKDVTMTFQTPVHVIHHAAWYLEPFHGQYTHRIVIDTYKGTWQENSIPLSIREISAPVYVKECRNEYNKNLRRQDRMPAQMSLLEYDNQNIDVSSSDLNEGQTVIRLNERIGKEASFTLRTAKDERKIEIGPFEIKEVVL